MIREATLADVPRLAEMGRRFHSIAPHFAFGQYDKQAVERMLSFMVESPNALLLASDTGMIGGVMAPIYFDPTKTVMEESFWWAEGGGGSLLAEFVKRSKAMGADLVSLSTLENEHTERMDDYVQRKGFIPMERRYMKDLS